MLIDGFFHAHLDRMIDLHHPLVVFQRPGVTNYYWSCRVMLGR